MATERREVIPTEICDATAANNCRSTAYLGHFPIRAVPPRQVGWLVGLSLCIHWDKRGQATICCTETHFPPLPSVSACMVEISSAG